MFGFIASIPVALTAIIAIGGAASVIYGCYRTVYKPAKAFLGKWNQAADSLVGFPPVMDPSSGKELKPATPPLSHRVSTLEDAFTTMIKTQQDLASLQRDLATMADDQQTRDKMGEAVFAEWTRWRENVEADWKVWRTEQDELSALIRREMTP